MLLSKSEYMMFLKHPALLWLKKHDKARIPPPDSNTQALFDSGNEFETYAERLFPEGRRIGFDNYHEYLDLPERTRRALDDGAETIFQGRFEADGLTAIVDVLQRVGENEYDLYEIKASTRAKYDHELDLAFQRLVIEGAGLKLRRTLVIHVNPFYIRRGEINPKSLCTTVDVTDAVEKQIGPTRQNIRRAKEVIDSPDMPDPSPRHARGHAIKDWLEVYAGLAEPLTANSAFRLCSMTPELWAHFEDNGIIRLDQVPEPTKLNPKQRRQVNANRNDEPIHDVKKLAKFLDQLEFPLYFLDYETLGGVIPPFEGLKPYQQLPFQYSLHIMREPGAELEHHEYLHTENSDPAGPLTERLVEDMGENGSVVVWYQDFEKSRNEELAKLVPEYAGALRAINDRVVDLMVPFARGWYVDKGFYGSASIKNILPVLAPQHSYKELGIGDGATAQRTWMQAVLDGKHTGRKDKIMDELREYCALDTLAMVEIYRFLVELVASNDPASEQLSLL